MEIMEWIGSRFEYDSDVTHVHSSLDDVLHQQAGVCQDFAHVMITVVRSWGFPARYAMGYVDPGYCDEGVPLATHAWAEVLIPGAGWRGFDPTHGVLAIDSFVVAAVGRDDQDAAPVRGSFKGDHGGGAPGGPPSRGTPAMTRSQEVGDRSQGWSGPSGPNDCWKRRIKKTITGCRRRPSCTPSHPLSPDT